MALRRRPHGEAGTDVDRSDARVQTWTLRRGRRTSEPAETDQPLPRSPATEWARLSVLLSVMFVLLPLTILALQGG